MALSCISCSRPQTIYACTCLLNGVQFGMCCSGLWRSGERYVSNRWTRLYTLGMAALLVGGLIYTIYAKVNDPQQLPRIERLDNLLLSIACLELFMSTFVFICTMLTMQRQARRYAQFFERVHELDRRLKRDFGADLNYYKLLRKNVYVVLVIVVAYVSAVCSGIAQMAQGDFWTIFMGAWCYTIITGGPHLSGYVHINLAEILTIRFRLLQQLLRREHLQARFPQLRLRQRRIRGAIEMVKELHHLIEEINAVYRTSLLSAQLHDFTLTTSELYVIFGRTGGFGSGAQLLAYVIMIMLPPLYKMTVAPIYCHTTVREGRECLRLIEQVDTWLPQNRDMRDLVSAMMFWRLENKQEFNSGLNIPMNKPTMTIVAAVILNYLLILIQFHMTEEMSEQIERQKKVLQNWIGAIN